MLSTILIILIVLAVFGPVAMGPYGYSGAYWPIGPVIAVILLIWLLRGV